MLKYANRILAVVYVVTFLGWATSRIGVEPNVGPITWWGAWTFGLTLAVGVWLGWQARGEANRYQ
jgi:hypothetical protein